MCGRFTLTTKAEILADWFHVANVAALAPRYNIPPSAQVLAVRQLPDNERELVALRWGLIPHWAKDPSVGNRLANARAESAAEKPSFRESFRRRRCLIPADGFYEWKRAAGRKEPYYIRLRDGHPIGFAGLWDRWRNPDGEPIESCTVLTTDANELVRALHDRMPVIVDPKDYAAWLDPNLQEPGSLQHMLRPFRADQMIAFPVSRRVNDPRNEAPDCIEPAPNTEKPPLPPPTTQRLLF
jgi:putative SOS response-associated peptidase YedK